MKKFSAVFLAAVLFLCCTACTAGPAPEQTESTGTSGQSVTEPSASEKEDPQSSSAPESAPPQSESNIPENREHAVKLIVNGQEFEATLYDTPAANSLYELLPLELSFEDYNGVEKIAYLTQELITQGEPESFDPSVGDLCLYAPWGNLSIFYQDFRLSDGLISLGHIDSGMDVISAMGEDFSVTMEKVE